MSQPLIVYDRAVDITLSRRGDYTVRAALYLAEAWDGEGRFAKIREVAAAMDLPPSFTPQILGGLARAGLAEARAGRAGGYRLTRPPEGISLLEVVEAAEGPLAVDRCPLQGGPCHWDVACALHPTWSRTAEAIRELLAGVTLADVVEVDRRLAAGERVGEPPPGHRRRRRRAG
jgi:Rrf2 family protein